MKRIGFENTFIVLLGTIALVASVPVRAQGPDAGIDADASTDAGGQTTVNLHPPHLLDAPPPRYPAGREELGVHPTVLLRITVGSDAQVTDVVVEHSAGADFDAEAVRAVLGWTFEPARRSETPVSSRIRVAVHFEPPNAPTPNEPAQVSRAAADEETETKPKQAVGYGTTAEVDAERLRAQGRGAGDVTVDRKALDAAPVNSANDLLQRAPGLYVANVEGDGAAGFLYLRGFNAEHGQDIELKLGAVPLNQPSNIHGQGYAYLGFIVPEVVRNLRVIEGVYDPRQGDFAVAGTVEFELGVEQRGIYSKSLFGSFGTFRQVGIFAPKGKGTDTFGAFQFQRSNGFGENRNGLNGSAMFQVGFGEKDWRFKLHGSFWGARYNSAGVLRVDDIESGDIGFYDVYPYATAKGQNAFDAGAIVGVGGERRNADGENTSFDLWLQLNDLRILQNYTGFLERSAVKPDSVGRGDLIEQRDRRIVFGGNARHRTARFKPAVAAQGTVEVGLSGRVDVMNPEQQNLVEAPQNQTWDRRIDADVVQADIGLWVDLDWDFTKYLNFKGGVRADVLFFDVNDALGNIVPDSPPGTYIPGSRKTAAGVFAGPRLALTGKPTDRVDIIGAYGEGLRSPQAITLVEGDLAPFTRVRSLDLGVRARIGNDEQLKLSLTGYRTWLDRDVIFEASEGALENIGPTSRTGFVFYAVTQPLSWLYGAFSVTYVRAVLEGPPPPTVENPTPALGKGDLLPFVPPWIIRLDLSATDDLVDLGKYPLRGHLGIGYSFIASRPLPFSQSAAPFSLLELSAKMSWRFLEVGLQIYNLLGAEYASNAFAFVSDWNPNDVSSRVPARHITAGSPRMFLFMLGIRL